MKDKKENFSLNQNLFNEKSWLEKTEEKLKQSLFNVFFVLLKHQKVSIWVEFIFIIIQLLQFMSFPFRESVIFAY